LWRRIKQAHSIALPLAVWAMTLAHLGVGVFAIGVTAETAFKRERSALVAPGESVDFAGRQIRLLDVSDREGPNYTASSARFDVGGHIMRAERRFYPAQEQTTTEVAILPSVGGDLYIALGEASRDGRGWAVRLYLNPLVELIYLGAAMMAAGGVLALARLARRRATVPTEAAASLKPSEARP
jgi:cytochrome c-type biogenesis protein CcmF